MKRVLLMLLTALLALAAPAMAEAPLLTAVPPFSQSETATPTPTMPAPAPTAAPVPAATVSPAPAAPEIPVLVDRINSPKEHADFAFAPDAKLLEIYFPQVLSADAAYLRFGGETMMIDCATAELAVRITEYQAKE